MAKVLSISRNAGVVSDPCDRRDVQHLKAGIADGLADNEPGLPRDGGGKAGMIARLDEGRLNSETGQRLRKQVDRAPIKRSGRHDVIAGAEKGRDGEVHRCRAARRADRADAILECGEALLENRGRRVGDAGIEMAGSFEIEKRGGVAGVLEDIGRRLVDRHRSRAGHWVGALPGVQAQRVECGRAG